MVADIPYCVHAISGVEDSLFDAIKACHDLHEIHRETLSRNISFIHERLAELMTALLGAELNDFRKTTSQSFRSRPYIA